MHDGFKCRESAFAGGIAGEMTAFRFDKFIAEGSQLFHIRLHDGVFVHVCIHGRYEEDFRLRRHDGGREHIVSDAVCDFADDVGGRRCYDEKVSELGKGDVFDIPFADIREHIDSDIIAGQFAEGDRCHELGGVCRHDAVDISPFLAELAHETGCFESGDPAADSYDNVLIFKHHA